VLVTLALVVFYAVHNDWMPWLQEGDQVSSKSSVNMYINALTRYGSVGGLHVSCCFHVNMEAFVCCGMLQWLSVCGTGLLGRPRR
jgi:hypothetical protein